MEIGLSNIAPEFGSRKTRTRVGRGPGSGLGKTSGRGHKGQKARTGGKVARHFEGGQMPLYRRIPKLGFRSRSQKRSEKDIWKIIDICLLNRFESGTTVGPKELSALVGVSPERKGSACNKGSRYLFKILGSSSLEKALTIHADAVSVSALAVIEKAGGSVLDAA
jgi:large subunit ribosomal protein L15